MAWFKKKTAKQVTVAPGDGSDEAMHYLVLNLQGVGARARQEDAFTLMNALDAKQYTDYGLMFAVCDGMGGMKDGRLASNTAISSFRKFFTEMNRSGGIAAQLKASVFAASDEVEAALDGDGGSTVVIGIILHEQLYFASVGDSFFYLKRDSKMYRLNAEQNYCHQLYLEQIRDGDCYPADCREDPEAAALSQFLGMRNFSQVDCSVRPMILQKGDILLACSDGVGGVLGTQELNALLELPFEQELCRQIEQRIAEHANPNQDNYTALIIKCV